jgi:HAE1 family hydrophobic/amphiphilic exporter-1
VIGLWVYDLLPIVFSQIGMVMLIGLESKNAIPVVEFGVELQHKQRLGIVESAREATRQRLQPILMASFP